MSGFDSWYDTKHLWYRTRGLVPSKRESSWLLSKSSFESLWPAQRALELVKPNIMHIFPLFSAKLNIYFSCVAYRDIWDWVLIFILGCILVKGGDYKWKLFRFLFVEKLINQISFSFYFTIMNYFVLVCVVEKTLSTTVCHIKIHWSFIFTLFWNVLQMFKSCRLK